MRKRNGSRHREAPSAMIINKKKKRTIIIAIILALLALVVIFRDKQKKTTVTKKTVIIHAERSEIRDVISCTGTVEPRNRLEIKPTISGRVERILVTEGQKVRAGEILLWMSSDERAALIDAARAQGASSVRYWEDAYKPIPVLAPIAGTIIVRNIEPGQSVNSSSAVLVISDRLIVRASVDETDIGKVREKQKASISLDAYPEVKASGTVTHISYESTVLNNVTTYEVDITPNAVPPVFRSGMTANIDIIRAQKNNALTLPVTAVTKTGAVYTVKIMTGNSKTPKTRTITTGIASNTSIEILSGIDEKTPVVVETESFALPDQNDAQNPFFPGRRKKDKK